MQFRKQKVVVLATVLTCLSTPLFATSGGVDTPNTHLKVQSTPAKIEIVSDSAERIRLSGQLRTYSQQVASASCAIASGVAADDAYDVLLKATDQFESYLNALRYGDAELNVIGPETSKVTLADLYEVAAEWQLVREAVDKVLENGQDKESARFIDDHNLKLLKLTSKLASDIKWQYAHPFEISAADVMTMEIAGRQRMLTQKMSKNACEIWSGFHPETAKKELQGTMQIFEASLKALRFGLADAGIDPAPNDVIRADLDKLLSRWDVIKVNQEILISGGTLTSDQKEQIFIDLNLELADLEHLLEDYRVYAERAH